jgi:DNA polymerase
MPAAQAAYPGAQEFVPDTHELDRLGRAAQDCRGCDLYRDTTQAVFGLGAANAALMAVGEQPGDREDVEGEPFVGPAGRLLDEAFEAAGLDREEIYLTNAVKHFRFTRPRGKQRIHKSPARWQVAACGPWLLAELEAVQPSVVVLLGATAGQAVYGPSFRVTASRGKSLPWPDDRLATTAPPTGCVATAHPASVLRSRQRTQDFQALVADLTVARDLVSRRRGDGADS